MLSESSPGLSKTYQYDPAGNRTIMNASGSEAYSTLELTLPDDVPPEIEVLYDYDQNNRLTKEEKTWNADSEINYYQYDANGNQISKLSETIGPESAPSAEIGLYLLGEGSSNSSTELRTYDVFNRLKSEVTGFGAAEYTYQPDNLRLSKTVNGDKTTHIWDGQDIVVEMDGAGVMTAGYLRGGGSRLISTTGSATYYYLFNGHGDVTGYTDASGNLVKSYKYDAFGSEIDRVVSDANPFRYSGEYYDLETNTYYLRARNYSPATGFFLTEDPHWNPGNMIYGDEQSRGSTYREGMPYLNAIRQSSNLYVYAGNNPIMYKDSNGQFWDIVLDIGSLILGIGEFIAEPSWGNAGMVELDIVGAIIHFVPSAGVKVGVKALTKADDVVDVVKGANRVDNAVDAAKGVRKIVDGMKVSTNQALDMAGDFLGPGYKEVPLVFFARLMGRSKLE